MLPIAKSVHRVSSAVVEEGTVYVGDGTRQYRSQDIFTYNSTSKEWSTLPDSPNRYCSLAVVKNLLTIIGGQSPSD